MKSNFKRFLIAFLVVFSFVGFQQLSASANELGTEDGEITPMAGNPYYTWAATSKTVTGTTYGAFKVCGSAKTPSTLSCGGSTSVSSTYSGQLEIPLKTLGVYVGATLNVGSEKNHSWSKSFNVNGNYEALVRPAYTNYRVVQQRYMHLDGQKIKDITRNVTVKKFSHFDYSWRSK